MGLFYVILSLIQIPFSNAGGNIAHLGGAIYGFYYAKNYNTQISPLDIFFKGFKKINIKAKNKIENQVEIDKILDNTKFNGVEILDSAASKSVAINYSGDASSVTSTVGPSQALTAMAGITDATGADTTADTFLGTVAAALGNIAADLTALKAFQGAASATSANLAAASARIMDTDYATETASLTKNSILNQAALSLSLIHI